MAKQRYMQQQSIEDATMSDSQDANDGDNHATIFENFVEHGMMKHIQNVPFVNIISNYLEHGNGKHRFNLHRNGIDWYCEAERRVHSGRVDFTFRFPTFEYSEFSYDEFEVEYNQRFKLMSGTYHGVGEWREFDAPKFCQYVCDLLPLTGMQNGPCRTRIFVNKLYKRIDIDIIFDSASRQITITFEYGHPARPDQITQYWY